MIRILRFAVISLVAAVLPLGLAGPAGADVSVRNGKVADLYVRSASPSIGELERQYAAFWNPNLPIEPKYAVSLHGNTAPVQKNLRGVMSASRSYDLFSIQGRIVAPPVVTGDRMTARAQGVMAGFPATSFTYYYVRQNGLWKFDWKANCGAQASGCINTGPWGY